MKHLQLPFLIIAFALLVGAANAKTYSDKDYTRKPVWIEMIKDTSANYFEVQKAYKLYFENHEKPATEHDQIGERTMKEKYPSKKERRLLEQDNNMRIEIKKYEHWRDMMLPYVQQDGHILTPTERLKIYNQLKK